MDPGGPLRPRFIAFCRASKEILSDNNVERVSIQLPEEFFKHPFLKSVVQDGRNTDESHSEEFRRNEVSPVEYLGEAEQNRTSTCWHWTRKEEGSCSFKSITTDGEGEVLLTPLEQKIEGSDGVVREESYSSSQSKIHLSVELTREELKKAIIPVLQQVLYVLYTFIYTVAEHLRN